MQDVVEIAARTAGFAVAAMAALYSFASIAHVPAPLGDDDEDDMMLPIEASHVATGDIVLFRGRSATSAIIRTFSHCQWTHVGIAVRRDGRLFILHSDPKNGCIDHLSGDGCETSGVQLNDLGEYTAKYEGDVYIRQLRRDDTFDDDALEQVMAEVSGCRFSDSLSHKARSAAGATAWIPRCRAGVADDGKRHFFCSELAAYVLARCTMLDAATTDVRTYHPGHFAPDAECFRDCVSEDLYWPFLRPFL
ncbi:hypothetical protein [Medusavirus stheno T3]|uniref:Permuted papain-like amidase YaeF/Yiix C92 family enzyme n=1 Tax=Medusavirus stheno T3 TaxID=3069717 RepID=A0A7S7YFD9_9VIRU|nr:hypothetical protein QKU73_gp255 [Acanthamoeba castellanii medusavirus]QPB44520.1 hypothetical protein [Medusavirus stheno T3]